jgi:hypothetical protein
MHALCCKAVKERGQATGVAPLDQLAHFVAAVMGQPLSARRARKGWHEASCCPANYASRCFHLACQMLLLPGRPLAMLCADSEQDSGEMLSDAALPEL